MRNKKQRKEIVKLTREYRIETKRNLKKLEHEREELLKKLAGVADCDILSRETFKVTISQIEKAIEQVKSTCNLSGKLEAWENK